MWQRYWKCRNLPGNTGKYRKENNGRCRFDGDQKLCWKVRFFARSCLLEHQRKELQWGPRRQKIICMQKVSFLMFMRQIYRKCFATKLQSYLGQLEQTPFTTMLIFSRVKWIGRFTEGTGMSVRQYVCLHLVQRKWTCRSSGWHWHISLHNAYFADPEPSSMLWMSLFSSKVLSVR